MAHSWKDPHIIHAARTLARALYFTFGTFLFLFVLAHIVGTMYSTHLVESEVRAAQTGLAKDEAHLKDQGDAVAQSPSLLESLASGDHATILALLTSESVARSIPRLALSDATGVVLTRTANPNSYGDNVFLTTPIGRKVSQGVYTQSVEMTGFGNEMFMATARPVWKDDSMIGALFATQLMNDSYAEHFRDTYLWPGVQVVFYSKQYGVYSDSFSDPTTRSLISSYFNSGSDWVANGVSDRTIDFNNGNVYVVANVVFPGLEKSPGGMLLFIPRIDLSSTVNILMASLTLLVFLVIALRLHRRARQEERGWRYWAMLVCAAIPVIVLTLFALQAYNLGRIHLGRVPYILYNSTVRMQPEYGIYNLGYEQSFSVVVDTGDESINAVQIGLNFDPKSVALKVLDTASSSCSYIIENTVDQNAGTADLSCVMVNTQTGQRSLPIARVVLTPLRAGIFTLAFDPARTHVLANDGLGTDVLRMSQDSSYKADTFNPGLLGGSSATTSARDFVVFSPTHPNESNWYNASTTSFVWMGKPGTVYRWAFDTSPDTTPSNTNTTIDNKLKIPVPGDGIFYFHLQRASGGPVAHYRIQADLTPPTIVAMNVSENTVVAGDVVRFNFYAEDAGSGIQKNYYVNLGDHLFLPTGSQLFIPFLESGDQPITLRVYDGAGNYAEKTEVIHVSAKSE